MNTQQKERALFSKAALKATACLFLVAAGASPALASPETSATLASAIVQQQVVTVTGVVKDSAGEPIIGANVVEQGAAGNGTITNINGEFTLRVRGAASVLQISYIGYQTTEVVVGTQRQFPITLTEDSQLMDEVVVIGYGTQRKGDVTSAISSVKSEDFTMGKIGDAAELIKGKVAGLNITKGTGDPNQESTIRLRGVISLEGSSTPLVLVDGIEGNLGTVAPENIASIDVLKDASAAAIYGTRGASGVVLITTKAGRREQTTTANYSGYTSLSSLARTLDFMKPADIRAGLTSFSDKGYDTDWLDAVTQTAFTHNHNFNIRGGSKTTTYSADFTYRYENGTIIDTYGRDMKMNFDVSHWMFNDILKVNFNMIKNWHKNSATNAGNTDNSNIYYQSIIRNPTAPIKNDDGTWNEDFALIYYYNPVSMIQERHGDYQTETTRLTGNITLEPIKGWQTNLMLAQKDWNAHNKGYYTKDYYSQQVNNYTGSAYHNYDKQRVTNLELTSKYHKAINDHRIDALVGYSYQYEVKEGFNASNYNFPNDFFEYNNLGVGLALKDGRGGLGSYKNDNKLIGFFGRISYGFADKYNVLVSIRQEGSSKFGDNNKWGTFPSASAGWTISKEEFMKGITWLNELKLRAGFGVTGVIPNDSYISLTRYTIGSTYYYDNGVWKPGMLVASNPNPDLKWEKSTEFNIGIDWSVLDDRLGGSIDVYRKNTVDMLWEYAVPSPPNLYNSTMANVGKMRNQGIEIAINAVPVRTKDFEWKTTLTASHNANKLLSLSNDLYESTNEIDVAYLGEPISTSTQRLEVGKPIGEFYGLQSVGVSERGMWLIQNVETGEVEEFTNLMLTNDAYRQYLGNGLPKLYAGWNNTFRYKGFDLSMQFTGQFGFKILNEARAYYENNSIAYNRLRSVLDAPYGGGTTLSSAQMQTWTSYHLEDGDFVRLTNLTLGYTVPLKENKFVKSVRAYLSGDNLLTLTGYKGLDPELQNRYPLSSGIEWRSKYPSIRAFTLGATVTF
jgi:TonB-linked SusC/RagA family outer membrane protein